MTRDIFLLLAVWTSCEALGQTLFKRGVDRLGMDRVHFTRGTLRMLLLSPSILGGLAIHGLEFLLWLEILSRLPLSVAFPLESVSYITVLVATRIFLREVVPLRRWFGVGLICGGIAILGVVP